MARPKKVTVESTGNTDNTITEESGVMAELAKVELIRTATATTQTPAFTTEDPYRALLLERPNVPLITNIHEAIAFVEVYQRWNRKVQLQFK